MRNRKLILVQMIGIFMLIFLATEMFAARGRVQISNSTIKTDRGTLIRGARVSLDIWDETPSAADINTMKNRGLNAFHIYAEYAGSGKAGGYNSAKVDNVVNLADQNGLYVILTIGCGGANGSFNQTFVTQFWNFYAPRYKDRTHVVYEVMNEPQAWSAPYNSATLTMEKNAYNQIRSLAPNTHIMMMSYSQPNNWTQAANECAALGISWSNASVAFHTYGIDGNENNILTSFFNAMKSKGIAYACTEPNLNIQVATTKVFEANGVSQTYFINVHEIATNNNAFYNWINSNGICWTPDYGTWPSCSSSSSSSSSGGITNGVYRITPRNGGKAVDVSGCGTANGTNVQNWSWLNNNCQKWQFTSLTGGYWRLSPMCATDKALDVSGVSTADGANVHIWAYGGGNNQQWQLVSVTGGYYQIVARHSGKCLDLAGGITTDGANIQQWNCSGSGTNGHFTLTRLSSAEDVLTESLTEYTLYPSPVDDNLHITFNGQEKVNVRIYNNLGALALSSDFTGDTKTIDVSRLTSGIYFIRLEGNERTITDRFIKK